MEKIFKGNNLLKYISLSVSLVFCACFAFAESCSTVGAKQDKYTASGCSYTTQTRTCCSDKTWSGWGEECTPTCNSDETWDSTKKQCCTIDKVSQYKTFDLSEYWQQHNACISMGRGMENYACATTSSTDCCKKIRTTSDWPTATAGSGYDVYTTRGYGLAISASRGGPSCHITCTWVPSCRSI